jgi:hypothetical protein
MLRVSASDIDELWVESKKVSSPTLGLAGEGFEYIQERHFVGRSVNPAKCGLCARKAIIFIDDAVRVAQIPQLVWFKWWASR